jgi:Lon protease-like protein
MKRELPVHPNLEHLKSQAKELLQAFRSGDAEARVRVRDSLPAAAGADAGELAKMPFALHDAQSVVAREYGFASFTELRDFVEAQPKPGMMRALMGAHMGTPMPPEIERAMLAALREPVPRISLVEPLPILPVRNAMLAVGAAVPLNIGRPSSLAALASVENGSKTLATFSQKDPADESPLDASALHPVGCVVNLVASHAADQGRWIVVRAIAWARLDAIVQTTPFVAGRLSEFVVEEEDTPEVKRLEETLRDRVRTLAKMLPDPEFITRMTKNLSARELADITIANLPVSVADKASYANEPRLAQRIACVLALIDRAA